MQPQNIWDGLSLEEKLDDLRADITRLFGIVEDLSHKDHVFVDAINLVHSNLDGITKAVRILQHKKDPEYLF